MAASLAIPSKLSSWGTVSLGTFNASTSAGLPAC